MPNAAKNQISAKKPLPLPVEHRTFDFPLVEPL